MPFLLEHSRCVASSHLESGILERSKTVPTVTENCSRQSLHFSKPLRCPLPSSRYAPSHEPQCGQTGPLGQRIASRYSRALSSFWKWGAFRADITCSSVWRNCPLLTWVCQVYNRPRTSHNVYYVK